MEEQVKEYINIEDVHFGKQVYVANAISGHIYIETIEEFSKARDEKDTYVISTTRNDWNMKKSEEGYYIGGIRSNYSDMLFFDKNNAIKFSIDIMRRNLIGEEQAKQSVENNIEYYKKIIDNYEHGSIERPKGIKLILR